MTWTGSTWSGWLDHCVRALAALALIALTGCTHREPPPTESEVVERLALRNAQPILAQVAVSARGLAESAAGLCERRDAPSLERTRASWRAAYLEWRRATPFLFGPAETLDLRRRLDAWPVNAVVLDGIVSSPDLRGMRGGADVRGYAAAEYLLFVPASAVAATAGERCEHLLDVTREIAELTARTRRAWDQGYARAFASAGDGNPFLTPNDAISVAAAQTVNLTERILWNHVGVPSGFFQDPPRPEMLDAWRSGSSRAGLQAMLDGLHRVLIGDGRAGLVGLVATREGRVSRPDPRLAAQMTQALDRAMEALDDGEPDLHRDLPEHPKRLKGVYRDLQRLQNQLVEATVVLELDVSFFVEPNRR